MSSLEIRPQPSCIFGRGPEAWKAIRHRWLYLEYTLQEVELQGIKGLRTTPSNVLRRTLRLERHLPDDPPGVALVLW
jgi:hypothetical protein